MNQTLAALIMSASALLARVPEPAPIQAGQGQTTTLKDGWTLQAAAKVEADGQALSQPGFQGSGWLPTEVPATVMAALVRNGIHKDPFYDRNLETISPEPFKKAWWYRTEFAAEPGGPGDHTRLLFEGLNYRADVWLNGKKIADKATLAGTFRTFDLDVTAQLKKGVNALAVEVYPPQPGEFTMGFVDWNPLPPDRNMGIFREVKLRRSGAVSLEDVFVQSTVNLKTLKEASLAITADLVNRSDRTTTGTLRGDIGSIQFSVPYSLAPGETKVLRFTPETHAALRIRNPRLWWPHNLGEPSLYTLHLVVSEGTHASDQQSVTFGIRQVADYVNAEGHRGYLVNGRKVLIRGGGWVDDLFLREDSKNLEAQFNYVRHMNLNTVRLEGFWGSSQRLYDLADRMGILLMPGWSCQWEWPEYLGVPIVEDETFGGPKSPQDVDTVTAYLRDQVRWLRNHPSIFVWVVGSDKLPWPETEKRYAHDLKILDPSRPYLTSCKELKSPVSGPSGVKMAGPYNYVTPNYWWEDTKNGGAFGFNTETGPGPQIPPLSSLRRMLPPEKLWPINDTWNFHCGRFQFGDLDIYLKAYKARYGEAKSIEEFAYKAQAANYETMRAMFESFGANQPKATGVVQWMLNGAWPKFYWQLYDTFLMPNGATYGARKGSQPLNVVYHYGEQAVYLVNDTREDHASVSVRARVYGIDSRLISEQVTSLACPANEAHRVFTVKGLDAKTGVRFLVLKLTGADGKPLADNFYWLSGKPDVLDEAKTTWYVTPNASFADFSALNELLLTQVELKVERRVREGQDWLWDVTLSNDTDRIAFFLELSLLKDRHGDPVLPVRWDDNYVSLLPHEHKTIRVRFAEADLQGEAAHVALTGWNTPPRP